jgi:adenylate kinase family enzyme
MDGNYSGTFDIRFAACDTILFLDMPRLMCLWRVIKRWLYYSLKNRTRPDLAEGCPEAMDWEFIQWVWNYPERTRPMTLTMLEKYKEEKRVMVLRSNCDVENFLSRLVDESAPTKIQSRPSATSV